MAFVLNSLYLERFFFFLAAKYALWKIPSIRLGYVTINLLS